MAEKTGSQMVGAAVFTMPGKQDLSSTATDLTPTQRRIIRKDPTVAVGRAYSVAPIINAGWTVQSLDDVPDDRVRFIKRQVMALRIPFLESALFGGIDFGWAPFEIVFGEKDGDIVVEKLKPLLQDITTIMVDGMTGAFVGFKQGLEILIEKDKALIISFRVEGTNWFGSSLLDNISGTFDAWVAANAGAERYDGKIAGSHYVVYYPFGVCLDKDNNEVDNASMSMQILETLESSGGVAVPQVQQELIAELNEKGQDKLGWRIEILEDKGGRQPTFIARLKYLDTLKVRGLMMPERSIMEGSHGTLAEASAHIDLALTNMDYLHAYVVLLFNQRLVNTLLRLNFGEEAENTVFVSPLSLVDERKAYLKQIYLAIISNMKRDSEVDGMDLDSIKDLLGIPKSTEVQKAAAVAQKTKIDGEEDQK